MEGSQHSGVREIKGTGRGWRMLEGIISADSTGTGKTKLLDRKTLHAYPQMGDFIA
jgi:hypothetical protein